MARFSTPAACVAAVLLCGVNATAEDNFFQSIETAATPTNPNEERWSTRAYLQQTLKYGWQSPQLADGFERNRAGISQIKTTLFGEGQGDINQNVGWQLSARGENEWYFWEADESRWQSHNSELRLRDAFIDFVEGDVWLRGGQQVFAWGQSEGLVITDVLSPQDLREPGQAELQDIREPVPALMGSFSLGAATKFNVVTTYSAGSNRYAEDQEPFDFFARYRSAGLNLIEQDPESAWEFAAKLDHQFNGGDFALMAARVNDNSLGLTALDLASGTLILGQQRQTVVGGTLGWVRGNWLLKSEVAYWQDVPMIAANVGPWPLHDQVRAMAGTEFSGWDELRLGLELNAVHTESHTDQLIADPTDVGYTAYLRHTAFNERLIQQARLLKLASEETYIGRWEVSLDWSDAWTFSCGLIVYKVPKETSLFYPLRHHDSLNVSAKYSF